MRLSSGAASPGSLWLTANSEIDSRVSGSPSKYIFNVNGAPGPTAYTTAPVALTRNTSCWAYGLIGLSSSVVGMNVLSGQRWNPFGYNAIAADVIMGSAHAGMPADGTEIWFVTEDGNNTLVSGYCRGAGVTVANSDLMVQRVSANASSFVNLPSTIKFLKIPPSNFLTFIPGYSRRVAILQSDQFSQSSVSDWYLLTPTGNTVVGSFPGQTSLSCAVPVNSSRQAFYITKINGDSGHMMALIASGELLYLTPLVFGGPGSSVQVTWQNQAAINTAIAATGSASMVTVASLAGF